MTVPPLKLDVLDYRGIRVVFTIKKWEEKSVQHTELCDPAFLRYVEAALCDPDEVWQDYDNPEEKNCYYKRFGPNLYAKVVVWVAGDLNRVVSAFEVDFVKETTYTEVKRLK